MSPGRGRPFKPNDPRTRQAAQKAGRVSAEARRGRVVPWSGSIVDLMDLIPDMQGPTWAAWRAFLKATYGLPMSQDELLIYQRHTERQQPPSGPVSEAYMIVGRRGGKSSVAALAAVYAAITFHPELVRPGETVVIPLIASDRRQARLLLRYVHGLCALPAVSPFVSRAIKEVIEFKTGVDVTVVTASLAAPRGPTIPLAALDEVAYWQGTTPDAANPDEEVVVAVQGGMSTIPNALLLVLSSPYSQQGVLFEAFERSFGKDDPDCLVWCADTLSMHPDEAGALVRSIERAWRKDPTKAASEYGEPASGRITFRAQSAAAFLTADVVDGAIERGVEEWEPDPEFSYVAFCDMSGGQSDSMALAIAHLEETDEGSKAVLDVLRERKPPLNIAGTIEEWRPLLEAYGLVEVVGDRYAAALTREAWAAAGFGYEESTLTASELYLELLPALNTGRVRLLDDATLRAQLLRLERRPRQGGKDAVTHPLHSHDDVANVAAGALVLALGPGEPTRPKKKPQFLWA